MRAASIAAAFALCLSGEAAAQGTASFVDPKGQFTLEYPADWPVDALEQLSPSARQMALGGADAECWLTVVDRPEWAEAKPWDLRRSFAKPVDRAEFLNLVKNSRVGGGAGAVTSLAIETVNDWPVQVAEVSTEETPVIAAWHARPGFEMRVLCRSYDGQDHSKTFRAIALSAASPRDAEWNAQAKEWDAKKAAADAENAKAAAAESAAKAEKENKKKR